MTVDFEERVEAELAQADYAHFDKDRYKEQISAVITPTLERFARIIKRYVAVHMTFLGVAAIELVALVIFFTFLAKSSMLAASLAAVFLTLFSYFMVRLYLNARKPEQLLGLRDRFLATCKEALHYQEGIAEHHLALANAACRMAAALHDREYRCYCPPLWADFLAPSLETYSCWWHWQDHHAMKEAFMLTSIDEHIKLVKCEPTNLEVHAALANAYVMLSSLYANPEKAEGYDEERWIPPPRFSEQMHENFRTTAERAIEEFKILNDYAPNDPWVHAQLAYSYHDLQMPEEEINEYQTILRINPDDKDTTFKLGMLYFQQGRNAEGLRIYEQLKRSNYKKAENLIKFYGAF